MVDITSVNPGAFRHTQPATGTRVQLVEVAAGASKQMDRVAGVAEGVKPERLTGECRHTALRERQRTKIRY
jgi:hypothetical protein